MLREVRTKNVGDWIESKVAVARDGQDYSRVGQLMMRPGELQDFTRRSGLREADDGVWRSQ